jgi:hypothetical protein
LLTHPNRITGPEQLYIDCAGCEHSPVADGDFFACLHFLWYDLNELLALNCLSSGIVYNQWGAASGFLAQ